MWKRGGRSSALERAEAVLWSSNKNRTAAPPDPPSLLWDGSERSSVSSHCEDVAAAGRTQGESTMDVRASSCLGKGQEGSRFLKKAPPPATISSQSPVRKSLTQQLPPSRNVLSSQRGSQTAALNRLAHIESRVLSHRPSQDQDGRGGLASAQSSSEQSLEGKRSVMNNSSTTAAGSTKGPEAFDSRSMAAVRLMRDVSLDSDEEDMRKLLGDSMDSVDNNFLIAGRPSLKRATNKMLDQKVHFTDSPPASPPSRGSPFRFTGPAQAHLSPSALVPHPHSELLSARPQSSMSGHSELLSARPQSSMSGHSELLSARPQSSMSGHSELLSARPQSSMSGHSELLSLEELFPVTPAPEQHHSDMSQVSSEEFKMNVMTLDDLVPANTDTSGEESEDRGRYEHIKEQREEDQEDMLDYHSDFDSESGTEPARSGSQVSEHLQGHGHVSEKCSPSHESSGRTEDHSSSTLSDTRHSSRISDVSATWSRSRSSSQTVSPRSRRLALNGKLFKEAAVQTNTLPAGLDAVSPGTATAYMGPYPLLTHTLNADMVEALSSFNPAVFALNETLRQQLAMTQRSIESSRQLHRSLMHMLDTPSYRYTTLEDTREYILRRTSPKLTMEQALEEVSQEMRGHQHI